MNHINDCRLYPFQEFQVSYHSTFDILSRMEILLGGNKIIFYFHLSGKKLKVKHRKNGYNIFVTLTDMLRVVLFVLSCLNDKVHVLKTINIAKTLKQTKCIMMLPTIRQKTNNLHA